MPFKWKDHSKPDVILRKLAEIRTISGESVSFAGWGMHEYMATLVPMFKAPDELPREIGSQIITKAVWRAMRREKVDKGLLLDEVNAQLGEYLAKKKASYHLVATVNVKFAKPRNIKIGDVTIRLTDALPRKYFSARKDALDRVKSWLTKDDPIAGFVIVEVEARHDAEAAEAAFSSLDLLRGWWNFYLNKSLVIRHGGRLKPINRVRLGYLQTLHNSDGSSSTGTLWYESGDRGTDDPVWKTADLDAMRRAEAKFSKYRQRSMFADYLDRILVRNCRALDSDDYHVAFVKLWSLLETLTGTQRAGYDLAVRRVVFHYKEREYHAAVLEQLRDSRNSYVHGTTESSEMEMQIYLLSGYVHSLMTFFIVNHFQLKTVGAAFEFMDMPNELNEVERRLRLLRQVQKFIS